jgi:uncharacterized protein YfkK (UPF0435 family)
LTYKIAEVFDQNGIDARRAEPILWNLLSNMYRILKKKDGISTREIASIIDDYKKVVLRESWLWTFLEPYFYPRSQSVGTILTRFLQPSSLLMDVACTVQKENDLKYLGRLILKLGLSYKRVRIFATSFMSCMLFFRNEQTHILAVELEDSSLQFY